MQTNLLASLNVDQDFAEQLCHATFSFQRAPICKIIHDGLQEVRERKTKVTTKPIATPDHVKITIRLTRDAH